MENNPVVLTESVTASGYELKNLHSALALAQAKFGKAAKTAENKFEGFKYVDLEGLFHAVNRALGELSLAVVQFATSSVIDRTVTVSTRLMHWPSGEWIQQELTLPAEGSGKGGTPFYNQKSIGAAITYGRKYGLKTAVGIADSSDDDVDKQEGNVDMRPARAVSRPPQPEKVSAPQAQPADDSERLLDPKERKLLIEECYSFGGNLDSIRAATVAVTGQDSSKLIRQKHVEEIKRHVYKAHNPPLIPEDQALADSLPDPIP